MVVAGYGGGMYGGGSSYGDTGMAEAGGGLLATLNSMLSGLPSWAAITIKALLLLAVAAIVGLILGQIFGRIFYPNPEKPSMFSKKQKLLILGAVTAAFVMVVVALRPVTPKDDLPVDGSGIVQPGEGEGSDGSSGGDSTESESSSSSDAQEPAGDGEAVPGESQGTVALPEAAPADSKANPDVG